MNAFASSLAAAMTAIVGASAQERYADDHVTIDLPPGWEVMDSALYQGAFSAILLGGGEITFETVDAATAERAVRDAAAEHGSAGAETLPGGIAVLVLPAEDDADTHLVFAAQRRGGVVLRAVGNIPGYEGDAAAARRTTLAMLSATRLSGAVTGGFASAPEAPPAAAPTAPPEQAQRPRPEAAPEAPGPRLYLGSFYSAYYMMMMPDELVLEPGGAAADGFGADARRGTWSKSGGRTVVRWQDGEVEAYAGQGDALVPIRDDGERGRPYRYAPPPPATLTGTFTAKASSGAASGANGTTTSSKMTLRFDGEGRFAASDSGGAVAIDVFDPEATRGTGRTRGAVGTYRIDGYRLTLSGPDGQRRVVAYTTGGGQTLWIDGLAYERQ